MTWNIGVATGCCLEHRILDVLSAVRVAGLIGVELGTPPNHFDLFDRAMIRDVGERLQALELTPVS